MDLNTLSEKTKIENIKKAAIRSINYYNTRYKILKEKYNKVINKYEDELKFFLKKYGFTEFISFDLIKDKDKIMDLLKGVNKELDSNTAVFLITGSYSKGTLTEGSDVDFHVLLNRSFDEIQKYVSDYKNLFKRTYMACENPIEDKISCNFYCKEIKADFEIGLIPAPLQKNISNKITYKKEIIGKLISIWSEVIKTTKIYDDIMKSGKNIIKETVLLKKTLNELNAYKGQKNSAKYINGEVGGYYIEQALIYRFTEGKEGSKDFYNNFKQMIDIIEKI